jgi:hypothetical protein
MKVSLIIFPLQTAPELFVVLNDIMERAESPRLIPESAIGTSLEDLLENIYRTAENLSLIYFGTLSEQFRYCNALYFQSERN